MRLTVLLLFISLFAKAQLDSALTVPLLGINFGGQMPSGDLVERFGNNLRVGGSFLIKTKKNWIYGLDGFYMFGKNVKEDVLVQLKNAEGEVTDNEGYPGDIRVTERGFGIHAQFGRVFNLFKKLPNSGIMVTVGVGFLQHKINLYDSQRRIAAIFEDRGRGYDHLSGGLSFSQFIGYLHVSENRLLNFYIGFEAYQTLAKSFRKLNYDTGLSDTKQRIDNLSGFRVGWILPLYKKQPKDFYYD
ncbi:hypothetical protein [Aurantibacillus circumpalustris]|uniref:hypothetical protein n=1 Tax=Aurantibacillus circumpalustris TaxID=3036359 RepID=UPI00295C0F0A|nr:hypothetical protein [Aurantibacillus circumpalustris]